MLLRHSSAWTTRTISKLRRGISPYSQSSSPERGAKFNVLFMGRDEFSCLVLQELYNASDVWKEIIVVTNPDLHVGRRGKGVSISPLKLLAENLGQRVEFIPETKLEFRKWRLPDPFSSFSYPAQDTSTESSLPVPPRSHILITASFGRILTRKHLSHFLPFRRLNVHPSLLPQYRGPAPIQHALMDAEKDTGVCVIEMLNAQKKKVDPEVSGTPSSTGGIDAGAVWGCTKVPQPHDADFSQMRNLLGSEGGKLLVQVLKEMRDRKKVIPVPQVVRPDEPLRAAPMIHLQDTFINPQTMSADHIVRLWRAIGHQRPICTHFQLVPNSNSSIPKVIQLHNLRLLTPEEVNLSPTPGSVVYHRLNNPIDGNENVLLVRCTDGGVIGVGDVKPKRKPWMQAAEFWNGVKGQGKEVRFIGGDVPSLLYLV